MRDAASPSPVRVLVAIGVGTGLSLLGDSSLYTVLPTHVAEAGVTLAAVGVLLSANRFVRLALNGPAGLLYERWPRRRLFVPALFLGALSTALYALTAGLLPLLAARLLWGLAWAGIWVGGNTIVLDVSRPDNRGRLVGLYNVAFFLGAASGASLGGLLTDLLGYRPAMAVAAALQASGALVALLLLPETRRAAPPPPAADPPPPPRGELSTATLLMAVNRLAVAGVLQPTLGLFLLQSLGDPVPLGGRALGVATATGLGLSLTTLVSMAATPLMGSLSDRTRTRWSAVAGGLVPGALGFLLLAAGPPPTIPLALLLIAVTAGSNQGLSTALVGDLGTLGRHSRRLGWLFTAGDLASAVGPPAAYALLPLLSLRGVYLAMAATFGAMLALATLWAITRQPQEVQP